MACFFRDHVVRVEEDYNSSNKDSGIDEQMILDVQMLVCSVTYLGREHHHTNVFIQ